MGLGFQWGDYFDRIFCIHYVEYKNRTDIIERELDRIGILGSGIFEWRYTYKNMFEKNLAQMLGVKPCSLIGPLFIETKRMFAESLYKNYNRIMVIQDDALFLKDVEEIQKIIAHIPDNADCIQLEKRTSGMADRIKKWRELTAQSRINDYFVRADGNIFWGGACYSLTKEGMMTLDEIMTKDLINEDNCFAKVPNYFIAIKNICIQGRLGISQSSQYGWTQDRELKDLESMGISRSEYADV